MRYISSPDFHREGAERIGILLVNSGTPASPDRADVRHFLAGLLGDPRVIELPRALWLPILHTFILPFRPARSAKKYRKIWTAQGSPLVVYSNRLRADLATTLAQRLLAPLTVEFCMLYARPTVSEALLSHASGAGIDVRRFGATRGLKPMRYSTWNHPGGAVLARRLGWRGSPTWTWCATPAWARCRIWRARSFTRPSASLTSS